MMAKVQIAKLGPEEFAERAEALWRRLGEPGPGRSWAAWFADAFGITDAAVRHWVRRYSGLPVYAVRFLEALEQASLAERRADALERRLASYRDATKEARFPSRTAPRVPARVAQVVTDETMGALRAAARCTDLEARRRASRVESIGAAEIEECAKIVRAHIAEIQKARAAGRKRSARRTQRKAHEAGAAKAAPEGDAAEVEPKKKPRPGYSGPRGESSNRAKLTRRDVLRLRGWVRDEGLDRPRYPDIRRAMEALGIDAVGTGTALQAARADTWKGVPKPGDEGFEDALRKARNGSAA